MVCFLGTSFAVLAITGPSIVGLCLGLLGLQAWRQIDDILKAAMADATDEQQRLEWLQFFFACGGIGFGVGPMVGKWANASLGFNYTFGSLVCLVLAVVALLWAVR